MKHIILTIISVVVLSACSLVNEPHESCPSEDADDIISLFFEMTTSSASSRADDQNHLEEESEYAQLEDGIDFSNLGIFVFARMTSKTDEDETLVFKTYDLSSSSNKEVDINGVPGAYSISMDLPTTRLQNILFGENSGRELDPNGKETVTFRILLVANCLDPDNKAETWKEITGTKFSSVISQLSNWAYDMNILYDEEYVGNDIEGLYGNKAKTIPMFGTNSFVVTQRALRDSRPEYRIFLGKMDLLRALAKVRVVDNIQTKNDARYPKILNVDFLSSQSAARQLPWEAAKYVNGTQIHSPNIVDPDRLLDPNQANVYRLGQLPDGSSSIVSTGSVFAGFIPEQEIGDPGMPGFKITIAFDADVTREYEIPMTKYNGVNFRFGSNILRNHIYTLSVETATYVEASVYVDVMPWTPQFHEVDFTHNVAIANDGTLTFDDDTYASLDETTGRLVLNDYPQAAIGFFGLSQPLGQKWDAYLITTSGEMNAIQFETKDADGNTVTTDHISGIIDGQKTEIKVRATSSAGNLLRTAQLQVIVTMADGLSVPVNILSTEYGANVENITFVQNPQ